MNKIIRKLRKENKQLRKSDKKHQGFAFSGDLKTHRLSENEHVHLEYNAILASRDLFSF